MRAQGLGAPTARARGPQCPLLFGDHRGDVGARGVARVGDVRGVLARLVRLASGLPLWRACPWRQASLGSDLPRLPRARW
eukprot:2267247-Alexandrium_andersonii.AAC.1